ncbi:protein GUCD1-like [Diadema setosum]|uniref:protein GUCD1-like n=1 Tax=Diadema setosum TaxID=31175 RepID=UPI003B3B7533
MDGAVEEYSETAAVIDVPHILQNKEWDCGLACTRMILRYCDILSGDDDEEKLELACKTVGIHQSVWTIDIAHLMAHFGIKHQFFTITLGVDPTYSSVGFYNSDYCNFSEEEIRINHLFRNAAEEGISVQKKSLEREEILSELDDGHPAIVLVDANILHCDGCHRYQFSSQDSEVEDESSNVISDCLSNCFQHEGGDTEGEEEKGYAGHFVVICGLDQEKKHIFHKNPARSCDTCCCSFDNFDLARRSHGTDEDILFIHRGR